MSVHVPPRSEIPERYTWNLRSIFESDAVWEQTLNEVAAALPSLEEYRGKLEDPKTLHQFLLLSERVQLRAEQLYVYAHLAHDSDTAQPGPIAQLERARTMHHQVLSAVSFKRPEIVALGRERIDQAITEVPELRAWEHYFDDLLRAAEHTRSAEVEELLALSENVMATAESSYRMLNDTDLRFGEVHDAEGRLVELTQGNIEELLLSRERSVRREAWERYCSVYQTVEHTMTACLSGTVRNDVFRSQARRHASALDEALYRTAIPREVFFNTLEQTRAHLPIWHRYWRARAKALGVERLREYDIHASLCSNPPRVPFEEAVQLILDGLAPLGEEYTAPLRKGVLEDRWVDVFPNRGKRSNAYSSGCYGTNPFILMNYNESMGDMSVLAHELGHSMHSWFTNASQPYIYSNYKIFVAEVASNFNQAMVRHHLLQREDRDFQLAVLDETFANFYRYLFLMPILARFELEVHERIEKGDALTPQYTSALMADLFAEGYGEVFELDRARLGTTWMHFGHLYSPFYVYQYATGIAAANAIAAEVLTGASGTVEGYLRFLKAGDSRYPIEALELAGIDMRSPEPLRRAFKVLEGFVERLENLIEQ